MIVGGGASGLACAVRLLRGGKKCKIKVVDACERPGKKLSATGNGQGNLSNLDMSAEHYHGGGRAFAARLACKNPYAGATLFDCLFVADDRGRIYPAGKQASALTDNLISVLYHGKVGVACGVTVEKIERIEGGFRIRYGKGGEETTRFIVLATGGKAAKQFRTDGSSYQLALGLGHTLTPLYPSLVQVKTDTRFIRTWKGIRADCLVTAFCEGQAVKSERGDVIFTDYGLSGNAIFYLSSYITDRSNASLSLEFLPDFSAEELLENLAARRKRGCKPSELLSGTLHNQLGRKIIERAGDDDRRIVETLKNYTLPVKGTLGFDSAQVTRGGICMREVTDELESNLIPGLFFAGEILDVDGDCGGYNLQWAFTSGMAVADAILKRL